MNKLEEFVVVKRDLLRRIADCEWRGEMAASSASELSAVLAGRINYDLEPSRVLHGQANRGDNQENAALEDNQAVESASLIDEGSKSTGQQEANPTVSAILDLIHHECIYWQGRDEARRGGYAILLRKAKELAEKDGERSAELEKLFIDAAEQARKAISERDELLEQLRKSRLWLIELRNGYSHSVPQADLDRIDAVMQAH